MSCQSLDEQNEGNDDDWKGGDKKRLVEDVEEFDNREKPNLEKTETVNLEDHDEIKETSVSVHLAEAQKRDLIHL